MYAQAASTNAKNFGYASCSITWQPLFGHWSKWFAIAIYLIPVISLIQFIQQQGVNVPRGDDWEVTHFLAKIAAGTVSFADFFTQHNEHRLIFPRLIFAAFAFTTNWNVQYEMYFSVGLALLSFGVIGWIAYRQNKKFDVRLFLANLFTSIVLFSLIQWENWLWGFQISWFLTNLCLIGCVFIFASDIRSLWLKVGLGATSCLIASFSLAQGLMVWLAVIPSLLTLPKPDRRVQQLWKIGLVWTVLFLICWVIYFNGYEKPSHHPDPFFFLKEPHQALLYFFTLVGGTLSHEAEYAYVFGFLAFANFVVFAVVFAIDYFRQPPTQFVQTAAPWLSIGLFTVLFATITTIGRAGFGVAQAQSSRYTTVSILIVIALIQLWRLVCDRGIGISLTSLIVTGILTFLVWFASFNSLDIARQIQLQVRTGNQCLELAAHIGTGIDRCLVTLYPFPDLLRKTARIMNQLGFRNDPDTIALVENSPQLYGKLEIPESLPTQHLIQKNCLNCGAAVEMAGWAILPEQKKSAQLVLLSYGQRNFFETVPVNLRSRDIVKQLKSRGYSRSRWSAAFSPKFLPPGETVLNAWVYDSRNNQLVKLPGQVNVRVEE